MSVPTFWCVVWWRSLRWLTSCLALGLGYARLHVRCALATPSAEEGKVRSDKIEIVTKSDVTKVQGEASAPAKSERRTRPEPTVKGRAFELRGRVFDFEQLFFHVTTMPENRYWKNSGTLQKE